MVDESFKNISPAPMEPVTWAASASSSPSVTIKADEAFLDHHCGIGAVTDVKRPYKWAWSKNGALVAGAPSACSYTTPPLKMTDFGSVYSVKVFGLDGEVVESNTVTLDMSTRRLQQQ